MMPHIEHPTDSYLQFRHDRRRDSLGVRACIVAIIVAFVLASSALGQDYRIGDAPAQGQASPSGRTTPEGQYVAPFPPQPPWQESRVVKTRNAEGNGYSFGSGAVVKLGDDASYILTCAHVTGGSDDWVLVIFNDGKSSDVAKVIGYDRAADCALLKLAAGPRTEAFAIAEVEPTESDFLYAAGFPDGDSVRVRQATSGAVNPSVFALRGGAISGESGGPVCNQSQQVVGVIHSTDGGAAYCCRLGPIRAMLTQCYGGRCYPPANGGWGPPPQPVQPVRPLPTSPPISNPPINNPPVVTQPPPTNPQPPTVSCDCGPKWEAFNKWQADIKLQFEARDELIAKLELKITEQASAIANNNQNFNLDVDKRITNYFTEHPVDSPTTEELIAAMPPINVYFNPEDPPVPVHIGEDLHFPQFWIRNVDPRGLYSTPYAEVWPNKRVDLSLEPLTPAQ